MKKIFLIGASDFLQGLFIHSLSPAGIQVLTIQTEDERCALQDTEVDLIIVSLSWGRPLEFSDVPVCYMGTAEERAEAQNPIPHFLGLPIAPLELQGQLEAILKNDDSGTRPHGSR